jgi:NhaP-type Na+/H+ or K+/H+ antiporter
VSVAPGFLVVPIAGHQAALIAWFGIRGIGSIYYLLYAINHGLPRALAETLIAITLTTVAASIVLHGISVTPIMNRYARWAARHPER